MAQRLYRRDVIDRVLKPPVLKRNVDGKWKIGLDGPYENPNDWTDSCALLSRGCSVLR